MKPNRAGFSIGGTPSTGKELAISGMCTRHGTVMFMMNLMTQTRILANLIGIAALVLTVDQARPQPDNTKRATVIKARVETLLGRMTLEEKIGQLTQVGGLALGPNAPKPEDAIRQGHAGSILWVSDAPTINRLQRVAMEASRLKIPLLFGLDVIHGFKTIFPMPLALAASWDASLIERVQSIAAREARVSVAAGEAAILAGQRGPHRQC